MTMLAMVKSALHQCGGLAGYHRVRNQRTLTVLMFHRVLPAAIARSVEADPLWTVSSELFDDILKFVLRHYNLVNLDAVLAARAKRQRLPPRALLISFDDGWLDNLHHAFPLLRKHNVPAVVFLVSEAIESMEACWWQDVVLWALRSGRASAAELTGRISAAPPPVQNQADTELAVLCRFAAVDARERATLLLEFSHELEALQNQRQMLDPRSVEELARAGISIGVHGAAHMPLTEVANPQSDLQKAQMQIARHVGGRGITALSFPHGRYDETIVNTARSLGFALQFTSDSVVNPCANGYIETDMIGRIPVFSEQIVDRSGRFSGARCATWLFLRPKTALPYTASEA